MNKRVCLNCLLVIVFLLSLVGCAPGDQAGATGNEPAPAASSQPQGNTPEAEEPAKKGGDLIIAVPANLEPASFDGHIDPFQSTWLYDSFISDPLLILAPNGEYQPALAERWELSEDGKSWTFYLRDDVYFQDGTPFNAEAVKYNFERVKDPALGSAQLSDDLGPIKSVEVVDEFTVRLNYDAPWATLLDGLRRMPIWSPTAADKYDKNEFDKHLVGTGPFLFTEWVANDHVTFTRWEDYGGWNPIQNHEGPVYLNSVTIRFIGEEAVLGGVVANGNAHIAQELPAAYVVDYQDTQDATLMTGYQAGTGLQWVMNTTSPPLDQLKVRQALLYATDQDEINEILYDGLYLTQKGPLNSVHPCYWDGVETMYPFDLEKAASLLEEAGWRDENGDGIREAHGVPGVENGDPLIIRFSALHHEEIGEALQLTYKEIGIDLKVEVIPGPVQLDRVNQRDFELMYERQRSPDPRILDQIWNSKYDQPGGWAWSGLKIAEVDQLLEEIAASSDIEYRCELAKDVQRIVMENAGMLPTLSQPVYYAVDNSVKDFLLGAEGNWFFLNNAYIVD